MKLLDYLKVIIFSALYFIVAVHLRASDQKTTKPQNKWCPILSDEPAEPKFTVSYKGKSVGLCCDKCKQKFLKNPDQYFKNLPQFNKSEGEGKVDTNLRSNDTPAPRAEEQNKISIDNGEVSLVSVKEEGNQAGYSVKHHHKKSDSSEMQTSWCQVFHYAGKFHPLVIHFPIALTIMAALSEAVYMQTKNTILSNVARVNLIMAGFSAILAAILGWANGEFIKVSPDMESVLFRHRWLGISSTICLICAIFFSESAHHFGSLRLNLGYRACLFTAALLITITGHLGATLVFGSDYFNW